MNTGRRVAILLLFLLAGFVLGITAALGAELARFPDTTGLELVALEPTTCGGYFRAWAKPGGAYAVLIEYGILQDARGASAVFGDVVIAITYNTTTGDAEHVYVRRRPRAPVEVMTLDEVKAISASPCDLLVAYLNRTA